jgi:UDP-3-O-acyl N-acetylglucosamine deacetylase
MRRRTVASTAECSGVGLHSGRVSRLRVRPAPVASGIVFRRTDLAPVRPVPAALDSVAATERRTALRVGEHRVDTVEHLLAAVAARELDDLMIELDGPEVPIFDGSFGRFVALLDEAGVAEQGGTARMAVLDSAVELALDESAYHAAPADALRLEVTLEYAEPVIGRQTAAVVLGTGAFERELAPARTFGFRAEVEPLRARGLLAGASEGCAILLEPERVCNTTLRWPNEFARHKAGDLLGDLTLLGARLQFAVQATRPSHRGNIAFARLLAGRVRYLEE